MQDRSISEGARLEQQQDSAVLDLLLEEGHFVWSIAELEVALGSATETADALSRLEATGLVHKLGGYVFASRAAARAWQVRV